MPSLPLRDRKETRRRPRRRPPKGGAPPQGERPGGSSGPNGAEEADPNARLRSGGRGPRKPKGGSGRVGSRCSTGYRQKTHESPERVKTPVDTPSGFPAFGVPIPAAPAEWGRPTEPSKQTPVRGGERLPALGEHQDHLDGWRTAQDRRPTTDDRRPCNPTSRKLFPGREISEGSELDSGLVGRVHFDRRRWRKRRRRRHRSGRPFRWRLGTGPFRGAGDRL